MKIKLSILLVLSLVIAFALVLPGMFSALNSNRAASAALAVCLDMDPLVDMTPDQQHPSSWFRLMEAFCQNPSAVPVSTWKETITNDPERLAFLPYFRPGDLELAAYAVQTHPQSASANFWFAELAAANDDLQSAIQAYQRGLQSAPADGLAWMALGRLQEGLGDLESAAQAFSQACIHVDRGKNGCPNASRVYITLGDYTLAEHYARQTLRQLPGYLPGVRYLATALVALGKTNEALPYLRELAESGDQEAINTLQELGVSPP